jgi:hypothetical protein
MRFSSIEPLEPRIAPASLTGRVLSYTDVDGDKVNVTLTKGTLTSDNFVFDTAFGSSLPQQLLRISLENVADVGGTDIQVKVTRAPGGDGVAHIGEIIAFGKDLGRVVSKGDLSRILAGDTMNPAPALELLSLGSYGVFDGATQLGGAAQTSTIMGGVPKVIIRGDLAGGAISIQGSVTSMKIGGSILGGEEGSEGRIVVSGGNVGKMVIGGDVIGGSGVFSGNVFIDGNLGSLLIRGSLIGGNSTDAVTVAQIDVGGAVPVLNILGSVRGASGTGVVDSLAIGGPVGTLTIGGSFTGVDGKPARIILAEEVATSGVAVGSVVIKKSMQNAILHTPFGPGSVDRIFIGGSFVKSTIAIGASRGADSALGTVDDSLNAAAKLNQLVIKGPATGTLVNGDSYRIEAGQMGTVQIQARPFTLAPGGDTVLIARSGDLFLRDEA